MSGVPDHPVILIVDDNPESIQVAASVLSDAMACDLSFATSAAEALEVLRFLEPDLILLDVGMPGMDGYELCRRLKADPATHALPVIFVTAHAGGEDMVRGFEAGAADHVAKPFRPEELVARVRVHTRLRLAEKEVRTLRGLLPTCAGCKKIRDDEGRWHAIEVFIAAHSQARFSHGLCPDCSPLYFPELDDAWSSS